ncbi:addiction module [Dickeya fangzhongdai]|uniref:addiction module n=1 Tax=Dickeya fangzhongdai TaxID=1778540 RepID=UPI0026E0EF98|nr:addiction module [Dickeya fangzhongdai]WKV52444.1 addiction module [Dickeya fangzhongdai]
MSETNTFAVAIEALPEGRLIYPRHLPATSKIMACVTLYNEPPAALLTTLTALCASRFSTTLEDAPSPPLVICMVTDGEAALHPQTRAQLSSLGFDLSSPSPPSDADTSIDNQLSLQCLTLSTSEILPPSPLIPPTQNALSSVTLVLALKRHNRGKLDSHSWFFRHICRLITPSYALQIDTGSVPDAHCLSRLHDYLEEHHHCAAVTARILTPPPTDQRPILNWQYGDFLWEKITDWPVSQRLGYMEVVPGQCSLIRYATFNMPSSTASSPLQRYLRGLHPQGLLEHNQFLAEDRVLGFEIVRDSVPPSTTDYRSDAILETDPCHTFAELVRQRRRWINSTLAVRATTLLALPGLWRQNTLSSARKGQIIASLLWNYSQLLTLFLFPSLFSVLGAAGVESFVPVSFGETARYVTAGSLLWLWCGVLWLSRKYSVNTPMGVRLHGLAISVMGVVINLIMLISISRHPVSGSLILLVPLLVLLLSASDNLNSLWRVVVFYLPSLPFSHFYLTSYSVANFSDISWGTKGLTQQPRIPQSGAWSRQRDILLYVWLGCNTVLTFSMLVLGQQASTTFVSIFILFTLARYLCAALCSRLTERILLFCASRVLSTRQPQ